MKKLTLLLPLLTVPALACSQAPESVEVPAEVVSPEAAPVFSGPTQEVRTNGIAFDVPDAWATETPSSGMRLAQRKASGESRFVVFSFPGGGTIQANMDRWIGQFTQADGSDSRDAAVITESTRDGMGCHRLDITGTWSGGMSDTGGPDTRFVSTIVVAPDALYFLRLTGPAGDVAASMGDYDALCASLRKAN